MRKDAAFGVAPPLVKYVQFILFTPDMSLPFKHLP